MPYKGDLLDVTTTGTPLTKKYDPATGTLTLIGNANAEDYKKVLQSLTFQHDGQAPTSLSNERTLSISVRDTGGSGLAAQTSAPITVKVDVVGVNSFQPLLDPSLINAAASIKTSASDPAANTLPAAAIRVTDLVRTGSGGNVSDGDGDPTGLAIVGTSPDVVAWYSINNGQSWQRVDVSTTSGTPTFTPVSKSNARLLYANDSTWLYLGTPEKAKSIAAQLVSAMKSR